MIGLGLKIQNNSKFGEASGSPSNGLLIENGQFLFLENGDYILI